MNCKTCGDTGVMYNGDGPHAEPLPCNYCEKGETAILQRKLINNVDDIIANENGITLQSGDTVITLTWNVIDMIAEESEPHYQTQVIRMMEIMHSQKGIKQ